ncbi:MAG: sterol desaturase family protein [Elusimicrobia bacterium]|nr:sterol desaturase family protein [Elusimicrobiota bacterium]
MTPRLALAAGLLLAGLALESLWPLRRATRSKPKRVAVNLALAVTATLILRATFYPPVMKLAGVVALHRWGLFGRLSLPSPWRTALGLLTLDYTLYLWHRLNHGPAFLWRFHNVHHADLDMDVSTASRFHFGELILSSGFRAGQVALLGIDPVTLILFETLITSAAQFHHANVRLPIRLERALNLLFVTPRMHGIHHSLVQGETDSNYSTIFSIWDRLHGTNRLGVPQGDIVIGVPGYRDERELTFWGCVLLPFRQLRSWRMDDGSIPARSPAGASQSSRFETLVA